MSFDWPQLNSGRSKTGELQVSQPANSAAWPCASLLGECLRFLQLSALISTNINMQRKEPRNRAVRARDHTDYSAFFYKPAASDIPANLPNARE